MDLTFSVDEITKFVATNNRKATRVLSDLGKLIPFIEAVFNTDVGKEILKDDVARYIELFDKVMNLEANEDEKAEYRYLKNIRLPRIAHRLHEFIARSKELKDATRL